jgi:hypothetical protein
MCGFCHNRTSFKKYKLKRLQKYSNRFFSTLYFFIPLDVRIS